MHLVVDASVAVKWLIAEDDSSIAREMAARGGGPARTAPDGLRDCQCAVAQGTGWARSSAATRAPCWHRCQGCRYDGAPTRRFAPMRFVSLWHWTGRSTIASILRSPHQIGAIVVTADLRFVNALASTEHGEAVMTLADYATTRW